MIIILIAPIRSNGGITSWASSFVNNIRRITTKATVLQIDNSPLFRSLTPTLFTRIITGGIELVYVSLKLVEKIIKTKRNSIVHATTSGSLGCIRDIAVGIICKCFRIKAVLHCHYGCLTDNLQSNRFFKSILLFSLRTFNQIWVLDSKSLSALNQIDVLNGKVHLTPNPIEISNPADLRPKKYAKIAFCGNLIPTKGILELVKAATKCSVGLHIIGPGSSAVEAQIRAIAGNLMDKSIILHGRLPNDEVIELLKTVDIVALPTYYPSEAFPMSILEAMSLGKLVISCRRAAIPDILTANDGTSCGLLVEPKSVDSLVEAIQWCQTHKDEADLMCKKAYEKVYASYRKEVVYDVYRNNYKSLLSLD